MDELILQKIEFNTFRGKRQLKDVLVYPGYDWSMNDVFIGEEHQRNRLGVEVGKTPFEILREDLNKLGFRFCSIDKGDIKEAEAVVFMDVPKSYNNGFFRNIYDSVYKGKMYLEECIKVKKNRNLKLILFIQEPIVVMPENYDRDLHQYFDAIFTIDDDMVDNKKYFKYFVPQPSYVNNTYSKGFQDKKLLTTISSNKGSGVPGELYSERLAAISYFDRNHWECFEFYGQGWGNCGFVSYKGIIPGKIEVLSLYKFCICYENETVNGSISEKIFDCFFSGCVPIYLGAPNVSSYIPKNTFIDKRKFKNYEELYNYLSEIGEEEYEEYLININNFLGSEEFFKFSNEYFSKNFIAVLNKLS